jgi:hypothetical protein
LSIQPFWITRNCEVFLIKQFDQAKARKIGMHKQATIEDGAKLFKHEERKQSHTHIPSPVLGVSYSTHFSLPALLADSPSDPESQYYLSTTQIAKLFV